MLTLHNVSQSHTNGSIRSLLKIHFVNIKLIKIRKLLDHNVKSVHKYYKDIDIKEM